MSSAPLKLPGADYNLSDGDVVAELFSRAAEVGQSAEVRQGCIDVLPDRGQLVVTGDLHDHGLNLLRILKVAALEKSLDNHVIFHEIIHGPNLMNGCDLSVRTLARLAALKLQYPNQVHLMLGNHELAQMMDWAVSKGGQNMVEQYDAGIAYLFGDKASQVIEAQKAFLISFAMAVRCANGVFCSHSLPTERQLSTFDPTILNRVPTEEDMQRGGHVYNMVWGRGHSAFVTEELSEDWNAQLFIIGHEPTAIGYDVINSQLMVVSSDDETGRILMMNLAEPYDIDKAVGALVPLSSIKV